MFLFFFGDNDYLLKSKIKEIEQRYKASAGGDFNLEKIDGQSFDFERFASNAQAVPLLATSRLIEVSNVLKNKDKTIHEGTKILLGKIPSTTVIVFIEEGVPDKRLGLFKALNVKKSAFEFKNLEGIQLTKFIEDEVAKRGVKIEGQAIALLSEYTGGDLWQLTSEIDKLASYCDGEIKVKDVEELVTKNISGNVFEMIESISKKNKKNALSVMEKMIFSGEPVLKTTAVINYQFRVVSQIKSAMSQTQDNYRIAKICSISPFQVMKNKRFADSMTWHDLSIAYAKLVSFDETIKSGRIKDVEGLKELVITL